MQSTIFEVAWTLLLGANHTCLLWSLGFVPPAAFVLLWHFSWKETIWFRYAWLRVWLEPEHAPQTMQSWKVCLPQAEPQREDAVRVFSFRWTFKSFASHLPSSLSECAFWRFWGQGGNRLAFPMCVLVFTFLLKFKWLLLDCRTLTVLFKQCSCCGVCVHAYFGGTSLYHSWII